MSESRKRETEPHTYAKKRGGGGRFRIHRIISNPLGGKRGFEPVTSALTA